MFGAKLRLKANISIIEVDPHYSVAFYAELWGYDVSTILRWFQDIDGPLRSSPASKSSRRRRTEIRIPLSIAMRVYQERTKAQV